MRSLIILEVEHGEDTDLLSEWVENIGPVPMAYPELTIRDYTVRVDVTGDDDDRIRTAMGDILMDTARTVSDPTQAPDIAVADAVSDIMSLLQSDPWHGPEDDPYTTEPTHLRVFWNGEWFLDGADDHGHYTESCWSFDSFNEAVSNFSDFVSMNDHYTWRFRSPRRSRVRFHS